MKLQDYEILYDLPSGEYDGRGIGGIRTTTIRAGRSLEIMCHPIIRQWPEEARRAVKSKKTGAAQEALNRRNRIRKIARLIDHNFTEQALVLTGTYDYPVQDIGMMNIDDALDLYQERKLPESMSDVRRDVGNFLKRLKRRLPKGTWIKWLYMIEENAKPEPFGLPPRLHFHMVIETQAWIDRDELEALWGHGRCDTDRLELKHRGGPVLARYLNKNKRGGRWWSHSRNLVEPAPRVSDRKVSRRRAALIAEDVRKNAREIFEKLYPGYALMEEPEVKYSDFVAGVYIYARMRRRD